MKARTLRRLSLAAASLLGALFIPGAPHVSAAPSGRGTDTSFTFSISDAVVVNSNANVVWLGVFPQTMQAPLAQMRIMNATPIGAIPPLGTAVKADVTMKFRTLADKAEFIAGGCTSFAPCSGKEKRLDSLSTAVRVTQTASSRCDSTRINQAGYVHPYYLCRRANSVFLVEGQVYTESKFPGFYNTPTVAYSLLVNGKAASYPLNFDFIPRWVTDSTRLVTVKLGQFADVRSDGKGAYWSYATAAV